MLRPFLLLKAVKYSHVIANKIKVFLKNTQYFDLRLVPRDNPAIMKLDSPEFKSLFTLELMTLATFFKDNNYEIRIAGGAVRDLLMGRKPKDVDFATTATPEQMKKMFEERKVKMFNLKGEIHGTVTARINNKENFEITTLRIDKITDGRHAKVEFTTDWKLDASRRDLTINSMFLGLDGTVYDYFHGYDDLQKRRVVFVGDPKLRIMEDYLRLLRYFRFYGRIAEKPDNHDENTIKAIKETAKGLGQISGERIWLEVSKILVGNFSTELMLTILECGCGPHIGLPENPNIAAFKRQYNKTKNIYLQPVTKITSLFNTEEEWLKFNSRVKLSAFERDLGLFIIKNRNDLTISFKWCQKVIILNSGKAKLNTQQEWIKELLKYHSSLSVLREFQQWKIPKFPVTGNDLKNHGVPMGKPTGEIMVKLKEYWVDKDCKPSFEELMGQVPNFLNEMGFHFRPPP